MMYREEWLEDGGVGGHWRFTQYKVLSGMVHSKRSAAVASFIGCSPCRRDFLKQMMCDCHASCLLQYNSSVIKYTITVWCSIQRPLKVLIVLIRDPQKVSGATVSFAQPRVRYKAC